MHSAPLPDNEPQRLAELRFLRILDTPFEERFDRITRTAARLFHVPIALVSLVDENRQWFKSCQGLDARETGRNVSFCSHAILADGPLIIEDARKDSRFADNPLVTGPPHVIFYAGHPLTGPGGHKLGTLCLIDHSPRTLDKEERTALRDMAAWAEMELSSSRMQSLIECLADAMIIFNGNGRIEELNPAAEALFAIDGAAVIGASLEKLIPAYNEKARTNLTAAMTNESGAHCAGDQREMEGLRGENTTFPLEISISRTQWGGRFLYLAIIHDLTFRKKAEERLRLQGKALTAAANAIMICDPQARIEWVNPAFTKLTGYSEKEAIGQSANLLKSGKQDPSYYRELWETVSRGEVWQGELRNRRKDGSHYSEEMTITPVRDDAGTLTHFIAIKQDVTDRRQAEENLKAQFLEAEKAHSETSAILNATKEAIMLVAPNGHVLEVNKRFEQFFAVVASEMEDRPHTHFLPAARQIFADPEAFADILEHSMTDSRRRFKEIIVQKWPQKRELELFSTPVSEGDGDSLGRLYVFRDITRDRQVDRMKSEFVSLVSHELRTPITSIMGYMDLVLDGDAGPITEEQEEYLRIARRNSARLSTLVNDLLDVSRIESGSVQLKYAEFDPRELITGVVDFLKPVIEKKEQTIEVDLPGTLPKLTGDSDRLNQVLTNLISNAHKYTPAGGRIHVYARQQDQKVRISVQDSGIGLSETDRQQLFSKFFRADNAATREVGGTGLGLWITRSLVEMHGGAMHVASELGGGSTFSFTLPST